MTEKQSTNASPQTAEA